MDECVEMYECTVQLMDRWMGGPRGRGRDGWKDRWVESGRERDMG